MRPILNVGVALLVGGAAGFIAACQTYDFEPVEPLAISQTTQTKVIKVTRNRPNVFLIVDQSTSMNSACSGCPTRWQALQSAMNTFLTDYKSTARFGLAIYPYNGSITTSAGCTAPTVPYNSFDILNTDDGAQLDARATQIRNVIVNDIAYPRPDNQGTPTGETIRMAGALSSLQDSSRDNFILLLTDGLPNCNFSNPNTCSSSSSVCRTTCTDGSGQPVCLGTHCCLDKDNTVTQIRNVRAKGIKTIVVGFGADLTGGTAREVLQAMAQEGGFARACPNGTNAECGTGNTCNTSTRLCDVAFYSSASAAELAAALAEIGRSFDPSACDYVLEEQPSDPRLISLYVDGVAQPSETWTYSAGKVTINEPLCTQLKTSGGSVEVRVVQKL